LDRHRYVASLLPLETPNYLELLLNHALGTHLGPVVNHWYPFDYF
jgi:hypothetical protein